jgi:hypothetical protein
MADAAVRAVGARRSPLCARRLGRQGTAADPDPGRRSFPDSARRAAGQSEISDRGRGGVRQPAFRRCPGSAARSPRGRSGGVGGRRHVAPGPAFGDGGEPRPACARADRGGCRQGSALGPHGGSAPNPLRALASLAASLHAAAGRVAVAGFHDGVLSPDPAILRTIEAVDFDAGRYFAEIGARLPDPLPIGAELLRR